MKKNSDREMQKTKILAGLTVSALVISTLVLYLLNMGSIENIEMANIAIVLFLVVGAIYIIWDRAKNFRKGLPAEDEFMKKVNYKAGYYGFIAAIWGSLIIMWMEDMLIEWGLAFRHGPVLVMLLSAIVFVVSYIYLSKRGVVE